MHFTKAIVRTPCERIAEGLSSANLGKPDHKLALIQHEQYIRALKDCGLEVIVLPPNNDFPDSTFVEDTALLTPELAVVTNPGVPSRKGEIAAMHEVLTELYNNIEFIREPGTLEAGDVMMAGKHFYIGLSDRTNTEGAIRLSSILEKHGMTSGMVEIAEMLHLKSGISYLENNTMLAVNALYMHPAFRSMHIIPVPENEAYAANSLWINNIVLVPDGYPVTLQNIRDTGYETIVLDMSEFRKLDGGLSCLSLRC